MVSRSNQQLKKKITIAAEDKLPNTVSEDIKDLFDFYDSEKMGSITYQQTKSILHYITGGIVKRSVLEKYISDNSSKTNNFELSDIEKLSFKIWEEVGKDQNTKEINQILKSIGPYSNNNELESLLKDRLTAMANKKQD
jgi:Ca2+-binding EF-hand superfamily protein